MMEFWERFNELVDDGVPRVDAWRQTIIEEAKKHLAKPATVGMVGSFDWGIKAEDVRTRIEELKEELGLIECENCGATIVNDGQCWYCENDPGSEDNDG